MKFRDGYWGLKPGITLSRPLDVRDIDSGTDALTVFTSTKPITGRGDTLNTAMLTTEVSSPIEGVIRVRSYRFKGALDRPPHFAVANEAHPVSVETTDDSAVIRTGELSLTVSNAGAQEMVFRWGDRYLTQSRPRLSGHVTLPDGSSRMSEHMGLSVGENVYGLGERFTPFVKNGQVVDIWNEDGGTSSEQAYKNVPFYLTSRAYGVFVANPGAVSFEVGSEAVETVQFSVPGEFLDYYVVGGEDPKDVLRRYTALTGKPALPPAWSFGLWLTTSFTTSYDEETVNSFVNGMADRDIPLHVFHFDCFWMKEFQWVDFQWDTEMFSDPNGMLERLKSKGLHICVWINPYVAQKSKLFDEGMEHGYLVNNPDGSVWQWNRWQAGMGLVDFTNPDAVAWYQGKLRALLDMGVDSFKTDFGERIPTGVVYHDGSDPMKMHNYYAHLYNKAVFELLEEVRGPGEALVFARSASAGGQMYPVHWGGDSTASYESMAESLRGGLSLSMSGFGFWSHDIGGFENTATPDLFKRWVAFGMLSSHSRLHGSSSYRVPWNFDEESSDVLRFFVNLKCLLMPYLYASAYAASQHGVPTMRPMALEFPDDPAVSYLDRQYMLGDSLLVAPVLSAEGEVSYYVPDGRWTSLISGEIVDGGRWHTETHGYRSMPILVKPNAIVPLGATNGQPDYDYTDGTVFHLFEIQDGMTTTTRIVTIDGTHAADVSAFRSGDRLTVEVSGNLRRWGICIRGVDKVTVDAGGRQHRSPLGPIVSPSPGSERIVVAIESPASDSANR